MAARIFHITTAEDWREAQSAGEYRLSTRGKSLHDVGFIHCSYANQVTRVADAIYRDVHGLVLLVIDPERLDAAVRDECLESGSERFPHIYGPLNVNAVVAAIPMEPSADATFELPAAARGD